MDVPDVSMGASGVIAVMKNCWLGSDWGSHEFNSWIVLPEIPTHEKNEFCVGCIQNTNSPAELDPDKHNTRQGGHTLNMSSIV